MRKSTSSKVVSSNVLKKNAANKKLPTHEELLSEVACFIGDLNGKYEIHNYHLAKISKLMGAVAEC